MLQDTLPKRFTFDGSYRKSSLQLVAVLAFFSKYLDTTGSCSSSFHTLSSDEADFVSKPLTIVESYLVMEM